MRSVPLRCALSALADVQDGGVPHSARALVVAGRDADAAQALVRRERPAPLGGTAADQLGPRGLPVLHALGEGAHEQDVLTRLQRTNEVLHLAGRVPGAVALDDVPP